jgi:hypothetical protein
LFWALQSFTNLWPLESAKTKDPIIPAAAAYLGQTPPGDTPEVFAPRIVSFDTRLETYPTFSPDGKELYFSVVNAAWSEGKYYGPGWKTEHGSNRRRRLFQMADLLIGALLGSQQ